MLGTSNSSHKLGAAEFFEIPRPPNTHHVHHVLHSDLHSERKRTETELVPLRFVPFSGPESLATSWWPKTLMSHSKGSAGSLAGLVQSSRKGNTGTIQSQGIPKGSCFLPNRRANPLVLNEGHGQVEAARGADRKTRQTTSKHPLRMGPDCQTTVVVTHAKHTWVFESF